MKTDLDAILDECLDRVQAGESIDSCLNRYSEHAHELEPLLEMARAMEVLRATEPPRAVALARGRQRFLTEAARLREERARGKRPLVARLFGPMAGWLHGPAAARVATVALVAAVAFLIVSSVVVQAAASSLPGEPLYPVKAVARQVQLLTTLNPQAREVKEKQIQAEQREEVREAAERGHVFEVEVAGVIIDAGPGWITLEDGLHIGLTDVTQIEGTPTVGRIAEVRVHSEGGQLTALELVVRKSATVIVAAMATATPTPTRMATATATMTPMPTDTRRPEPTPTRSVRKREPTKTATPKPTFTPTPAPTKTLGVPVRPPVVELTGVIESIDKDRGLWVVSGQQIVVTSATVITGEPAEGRVAHIQAERREDGTFVAFEIVVETPATRKPPERVQFSGVIQDKIGDALWVINNIKVRIDDRTEIKGDLQIGYFAEVDGVREGPDQILAKRITARPVCDEVTAIEGVILSIDAEAGVWTVGNYTIRVNDATQIDGAPSVGAFAQVDVCRISDMLVATHIFVIPPTPTSTPTPTLTPTPVPTGGSNLPPTPTPATPVPTLESLPTATPTGDSNLAPSPTPVSPTPTVEGPLTPTPAPTGGSNLAPSPTPVTPAPTLESSPTIQP